MMFVRLDYPTVISQNRSLSLVICKKRRGEVWSSKDVDVRPYPVFMSSGKNQVRPTPNHLDTASILNSMMSCLHWFFVSILCFSSIFSRSLLPMGMLKLNRKSPHQLDVWGDS